MIVAGWQLLESRIGSSVNEQYVWGVRYVDDLVLLPGRASGDDA